MNRTEVLALLKANQNEKGIHKWKQRKSRSPRLKSFGIGLTNLRKLAKQIGRDHDLALELWKSDIYDVKIISLLIDDPKHITRKQIEKQVEELRQGHLAHVFSACGAPLAKTQFVTNLAFEWMNEKETIRRRCSYGLIYELSKSKKKSAPNDSYFLECIENIRTSFENEDILVQVSMGGALMGIGKRNAKLNAAALKVAKKMGPIPIESENGKCEPFDVVKHLTSDYIKNKFGLK